MKLARAGTLYRHRASDGAPGGSRLSGTSLKLVRHALRSPAEALHPQTRARMEPYFGQDLSRVRVHTGPAAAESARAVSADAYTLGRDIVFGPGKYAPRKAAGERLLAHELTHTLQQRAETPGPDAVSIASGNSMAEREAESASTGIAAPEKLQPAPGNMLQRSVEGDIAGGAIGAGVGAGAGALIGGPWGALVGGLLGGVAGLAIGDILSAKKRGLTEGETNEAKQVFGNSMNYSSVTIADATLLGRLAHGNAVTPFETIYFPTGAFAKDYSPSLQGMGWLIHEMTHVWQTQHGVSVIEKVFNAAHSASVYDYGGEQGLKDAAQQHKKFTSFNTEQQGDILRNYYFALKRGQDTSVYAPFLGEVQGSTSGEASGVLNDKNMTAPGPRSAVA